MRGPREILGAGVAGIAVAAAVTAAALPAGAGKTPARSFVDPTATVVNGDRVKLGRSVFVGPFAALRAGRLPTRAIRIGDESNVQDSVMVIATAGRITLGKQVILAHGAIVRGPASLGVFGTCPAGASVCPSFVGFNSRVGGATIEKDAMVTHLARVGPGVRIPSGRKVLPGKDVASQDEVDAETVPLTDADREFMRGVIDVNTAFASGYRKLAAASASRVRGVGPDPGGTEFNKTRDLPTFAYGAPRARRLADPTFRNRIIGDVRLRDTLRRLAIVMRSRISLRADEGETFTLGTIERMGGRTTLHALEHTGINLGDGGRYGFRSLVHGGPAEHDPTTTGRNVTLGDYAVLFRSTAGDDVVIGERSLIQQTALPAGARVPPRTVMVGGVRVGDVEW